MGTLSQKISISKLIEIYWLLIRGKDLLGSEREMVKNKSLTEEN
jgi:hypothetical protein